jgi:hypothetical protein
MNLNWQNKGVLSAAKRKNHFAMLTDEEVAQTQQADQRIKSRRVGSLVRLLSPSCQQPLLR